MTRATTPTQATAVASSRARPATVRRWAPRLVALGEFVDGYDLLVMGAALLYLTPAFGLTDGQTGLLAAITFIGAALGVVLFGELADRLGRRLIFMLNLLFFVVAAIAAAFAHSVTELMIARFAIGVGVGMDIPTSASYLAEIAPKARRGRIAGSLPNIMWLGGAITSVIVALILDPITGPDTWRWLFGLAAIPALLVLAGRQILPESPRWLRAHGREAEAVAVFETMGLPVPAKTVEPKRRYRDLFIAPNGKRTAAVVAFFACNCFGGAVVTIAGPLVIDSTGIGKSNALYFSLGAFLVGLTAVLIGFQIIDKVDRRKLGLWTCAGTFAAAIGIAVVGASSPAILLACFLAFSAGTWLGPGVLSWVWAAEMYPTRMRALGSGVTQSVSRLAIAGNVYLAPFLLRSMGLKAIAIYGAAYLGCIAVILAAPFFATNGLELEDAADEKTPPAAVPAPVSEQPVRELARMR
jgi:MFS transporter, putative metabolite transport protein